ncbi:acyltransferase family protein [Roseateles sp. DAIF2]|uniref:acyltransferase family protein n=1 Tax=Roseateles sp. DAIF2 TaxID=2714952 RepID=UPI001BC9D2EB|nr:heparan-alpha-glucosaminide N-acetyltransferase domain-containing protein [Roseateles sp. DAIF2]
MKNQRLASVDALRGLSVAAMLLVNNPGDWGHVYAPLLHAAWHGFTPTDLIFPLFLFIVGVSLALSLGAKVEADAPRAPLARAVLERALRILLLGLALHLFAWWALGKPEFRLFGVLQRIGLCFALAGLVLLYCRARTQWLLLAGLLILHAALLLGGGGLDKAGSLQARIDTALLGRFAYEWDGRLAFDPEGVLSTLGALASCLLGLRAGDWLRRRQLMPLLRLGLAALVVAYLLTPWLPLNKQLWTGSFVLWTGGWACLALVGFHLLVDRRGWPALGRGFGVNAITAYAGAWVMSVALAALGWQTAIYQGWLLPSVGAALGPEAASLAFALLFVLVWAGVARLLDKRGIYIKV